MIFIPTSAFPGEWKNKVPSIAYKEGDFSQAIKLGEELTGAGYEDPVIYFNLGNAYVKEMKLGKAILSYRRAERLTPRDADLKANLDLARGKIENVSGGIEMTSVPKVLLLKRLTTNEIKWLALFMFVVASAFYLLGLYLRMPARRVISWTIIAAVVFVYFCVAWSARVMNERGMSVMLGATEARFEPFEKATAYFRLTEGVEVKVLREQEGWRKIERPDGKIGWVQSSYVEKI